MFSCFSTIFELFLVIMPENNSYVLQPFAQNYDWGKLGVSSKVAQLIHSGYSRNIADSLPYAELWMGDHPNGPCDIGGDEGERKWTPIDQWFASHSLPPFSFLFKVLSVRKALSIQSHPDAVLAKTLHVKFPDIYKDPNPKPELALALTNFRALFGFRPIDQIVSAIESIEPLGDWITPEVVAEMKSTSSPKAALKRAYTLLMSAPQDRVSRCIDFVIAHGQALEQLDPIAVELVAELNRQFPRGDVGVLSVFFLNIMDLVPGQCIFMGPNVPHAYISGDIIECMTSSDNVIRGGLTPKFKDVEVLVSSLDYTSGVPGLLEPRMTDSKYTQWCPPGVPFGVARYELDGTEEYPRNGADITTVLGQPSIALVIEGGGTIDGREVVAGTCLLLMPGKQIHIEASPDSKLDVFIAFNPL
jgi:mannose-6-phosphate isomerase